MTRSSRLRSVQAQHWTTLASPASPPILFDLRHAGATLPSVIASPCKALQPSARTEEKWRGRTEARSGEGGGSGRPASWAVGGSPGRPKTQHPGDRARRYRRLPTTAYNHGMMGNRPPSVDSIAQEGALFPDWHGQQCCTAGGAACITGQPPMRTGLTKVGLPVAPDEGMKPEDPTIAG